MQVVASAPAGGTRYVRPSLVNVCTGGCPGRIECQTDKPPIASHVTISATHHQRPKLLNRVRLASNASTVPRISLLVVRSTTSHSLFKLDASRRSSLTVISSISADWLSSLFCSRALKLSLITPVLLVNPTLKTPPLPALRIAHRHIVPPLTRNLQTSLLKRRNHAPPVRDLLRGHKAAQEAVQSLTTLTTMQTLSEARKRPLKLSGALWIVGPRPAVTPIQRVPERRIAVLPARRRDVQRLATHQLHARNHKMQLHTRPLRVLMPNPCDVILLPVETGEGQSLESVHGLALLILAGGVLKGKGQHPMRIAPLPRDTID